MEFEMFSGLLTLVSIKILIYCDINFALSTPWSFKIVLYVMWLWWLTCTHSIYIDHFL